MSDEMTNEELVKRLREEAITLSGIGINRGSVDASLSALLAEEAADRIEQLQQALKDQSSVSDRLAEANEKLTTERADQCKAEYYRSGTNKQLLGYFGYMFPSRNIGVADGQAQDAYQAQLGAEAKLAKAVDLLKEARQDLEEYVTHEWPKDEHPVYERKWERDMELCRRIDATLAEIEGEKG